MWNINRWLILATLPVASALAEAPGPIAPATAQIQKAAEQAATMTVDKKTQRQAEGVAASMANTQRSLTPVTDEIQKAAQRASAIVIDETTQGQVEDVGKAMLEAQKTAAEKNAQIYRAAQKAAAIHIDDATQRHVDDLVKTVQSPEYQQKIEHYRELLLRAGGVEFTPAGQTATADKASDTDALSSNARLYVFISSSLPEAALRRYVRDVAQLKQGVLVLRGFIGGAHTVKPTVQFIANLLKKDATCTGFHCPMYAVEVHIDPIRFTRYAIERVPALVFEPNESFLGYCDPTSLSQATASLVVYGDARLQYALERLHEAQPAPGLSSLIARLEPVPWEQRALPKSLSSP